MTQATNSSAEAAADDGSHGHLNTKYWPATFEERGVVVPFTTPMLAFARARSDGNSGLEIIVPGLSGGSGVYIIGWAKLQPKPDKYDVLVRVRHYVQRVRHTCHP